MDEPILHHYDLSPYSEKVRLMFGFKRLAWRSVQIPIVMTSVDPLVGGFVTNLSHPGGNVTGVAGFTCETAAKRLHLLKEAVPTVSRIAALRNPDGGSAAGGLCNVQETERAAQHTGADVRFLRLRADALLQESHRAGGGAGGLRADADGAGRRVRHHEGIGEHHDHLGAEQE